MTDRELMQQALNVIEAWERDCDHADYWRDRDDAITALRERLAREEPMPMARPLTDELMDCVDRLGSEADLVDPRVWDHLLVYAPKPARQEQEPVAWTTGFHSGHCVIRAANPAAILPIGIALYTAPQREWVGLTEGELDMLELKHAPPVHPDFVHDDDWRDFAFAVEAKLREKNA